MKTPLVSIIVPTRNSAPFLRACLESIKAQTYPRIELIVVDRDSTDDTKAIAHEFTNRVLNHGPERSAQRNFGVENATGEYVFLIDSDMELAPSVVEASIEEFSNKPKLVGLVIPEESFGEGFWAQCKALERSFYVGITWIEAARVFSRETYTKVGGYDITLVSGEDWDLARRVEELGEIGRINEYIRHNEGRINLWGSLKKKYYYAKHARAYLARHPVASMAGAQVGPIQRYKLFLSKPSRVFRNPFLGIGMLVMKTCEFGAGALGFYG
jgi:glycosyltransferase involved in cell wall biosynthesis